MHEKLKNLPFLLPYTFSKFRTLLLLLKAKSIILRVKEERRLTESITNFECFPRGPVVVINP